MMSKTTSGVIDILKAAFPTGEGLGMLPWVKDADRLG